MCQQCSNNKKDFRHDPDGKKLISGPIPEQNRVSADFMSLSASPRKAQKGEHYQKIFLLCQRVYNKFSNGCPRTIYQKVIQMNICHHYRKNGLDDPFPPKIKLPTFHLKLCQHDNRLPSTMPIQPLSILPRRLELSSILTDTTLYSSIFAAASYPAPQTSGR